MGDMPCTLVGSTSNRTGDAFTRADMRGETRRHDSGALCSLTSCGPTEYERTMACMLIVCRTPTARPFDALSARSSESANATSAAESRGDIRREAPRPAPCACRRPAESMHVSASSEALRARVKTSWDADWPRATP
jgi:hypothetical protein